MSTKSIQRVSLLGSAAALALLTTTPGAQAIDRASALRDFTDLRSGGIHHNDESAMARFDQRTACNFDQNDCLWRRFLRWVRHSRIIRNCRPKRKSPPADQSTSGA